MITYWLSGNLQQEHSFCYSPKTVLAIRINGQLLLLMLAEKLIEIGCKIVQANTDGLFVLRDKNKQKEFEQVCEDWEKLTKLTLEEDKFERMYQFAINDYIAIKEGYTEEKKKLGITNNMISELEQLHKKYIKEKGMFISEVKLGKGMAPIIIPKAVVNKLADNVPTDYTVKNCNDIKQFLTYQKVGKQFYVEYNKKVISRINRFYASTNGAWLYKYKIEGNEKKYTNLLTASGVTILNKLDDTPITERNINYSYYITEANKIITKFKQVQLTLF